MCVWERERELACKFSKTLWQEHTRDMHPRPVYMNSCKVGATIITMYGGRYKFDSLRKTRPTARKAPTRSKAPACGDYSILYTIHMPASKAFWIKFVSRLEPSYWREKKSIYQPKWIKMLRRRLLLAKTSQRQIERKIRHLFVCSFGETDGDVGK
jgi:hypothetical protein